MPQNQEKPPLLNENLFDIEFEIRYASGNTHRSTSPRKLVELIEAFEPEELSEFIRPCNEDSKLQLESIISSNKRVKERIVSLVKNKCSHDEFYESILTEMSIEFASIKVLALFKYNKDLFKVLVNKILGVIIEKGWNKDVLNKIIFLLTEDNIFFRQEEFLDFIRNLDLKDNSFELISIRQLFIKTFPKRRYYRALVLKKSDVKDVSENLKKIGILPHHLRIDGDDATNYDFLLRRMYSPELHIGFSGGESYFTSWTESPILSSAIVSHLLKDRKYYENHDNNSNVFVVEIDISSFYAFDFIKYKDTFHGVEDDQQLTHRKIEVIDSVTQDIIYNNNPSNGAGYSKEILFFMRVDPNAIRSMKMLKRDLIYRDK